MNEIDTMYKELILDLNRHPLNKEILADFDVEYTETNPLCGDEITVRIKWKNDRIFAIAHQGHGCAISQAAISLLTEEVKEKKLSEIEQMLENDIYTLLGFEPIYTRRKCATLGLSAIMNAIKI